VADVAAVVRTARRLVGPSGKVGLLGFCLGGLMAFIEAERERVDAAVAYHGAETEMHLEEAAGITAPFLMHLAEEDEFISKAAQTAIKSALPAMPNVEVFSYPGCNHAFARQGGLHYDAAAAALA
jgi:carboxymethylenebutenolidase